MKSLRGETLLDLVVALLATGLLLLLLSSTVRYVASDRANLSKCRSNLKQLGTALYMYQDCLGHGEFYPDRSGPLFLVRLYQTQILTEPDIFICPTTDDTNHHGRDYRDYAGDADYQMNVCSYAGRLNKQQGYYPGILKGHNINLSQTTVASDDWGPAQGVPDYNHPDRVVFLYLDGHSGDVLKNSDQQFLDGWLCDPLGN